VTRPPAIRERLTPRSGALPELIAGAAYSWVAKGLGICTPGIVLLRHGAVRETEGS